MRSYTIHWNFSQYEILYRTLELYLIVNTVKGHISLGLKIEITQPHHCALYLAACCVNRSCLSTDLANKTTFPYLQFFTKNIVWTVCRIKLKSIPFYHKWCPCEFMASENLCLVTILYLLHTTHYIPTVRLCNGNAWSDMRKPLF